MRKSAANFFKTTPTRKIVRKSLSRQDLRSLSDKVTLERVFGLTTTNTNGLASNPVTGVIAYPAGCVIVLYDPKTTQQIHVFNPDKKTITCLAFSSDGKYLVSGESGQQPSVRVWEMSENVTQVAELRGHKSGITSVAFSPNQKLLVSIGDQHDMLVNVWNWKLGHTVACNKSGCRVRAVSFSENGDYLVTVGNRHVKFWYLDEASSKSTTSSITPINGRSGILGDQRNNCFTDVECGHGKTSIYTYCVTKSGLLCMFTGKRILEKWVELKAGSTNCIAITDKYIFCGCSDGIIRVFEPLTLKFVTTLPKPHPLGVNVTDGITLNDLIKANGDKHSPDLVAMIVNEETHKLTCVYNDHSLYIWDVRDICKVGKTASFLYHSACIWGVETYPYFDESTNSQLPYGSLLTCSSDDTIRIWNFEKGSMSSKSYPRNLYSKELLKVVYIDENLANLQDTSMAPFGKDSDNKNGVRCMQISPDGQYLATGDRSGNLRIYNLEFFDESLRIEAHESEILCVEFSSPKSGFDLLATSSRDRLIHIFDIKKEYSLLQTIDDHSSSITAVRFNYDLEMLQLLSCGADKVVMFHTAQVQDSGEVTFIRNTIVPGKATLYDMGIEPTRKYAATVGQDRNLRIYDIQGAKQLQCYKGSVSEEGNLIKFQLDDAGVYAAISCSDKTIGIFDFDTGECEAAIYGHSELVTGLKFTADGRRLISVSGDGCIFVWSLPMSFTETIRNRMHELNLPMPFNVQRVVNGLNDSEDLRRKTFVVPSVSSPAQEFDETYTFDNKILDKSAVVKSPVGYRFSVGQLPTWAQKQIGSGDPSSSSKVTSQPLGRWGERNEGGTLRTVEESPDSTPLRRPDSQDSLGSLSSDRSNYEQNSIEGDVIYPESNDDISSNEKTFQVTETKSHRLSRDSLDKVLDDGHHIQDMDWNEQEIESELEDDVINDNESDGDEAFSPLVEHFEKLATPAGKVFTRSRSGSRSGSSTEGDSSSAGQQNSTFFRKHRASISAKFLSRSQRATRSSSSSNNSTINTDDQRKRLEALKAKFMSSSSSSITASTNKSKSCTRRSSTTYAPHTPQTHRRSIDVGNLSPQLQARETISSSLKKNNLMSRSCQNLSMTSSFQSTNQIPTSPSKAPDLSYDPRRSSTPMHQNLNAKDDRKNKRRTINNVWANGPLSPVQSPGKNRDPFQLNKTYSAENVVRRSGGNRKARPKSLAVDTVSQSELRKQIKSVTMHSYHSDNEEADEQMISYVTNDMLHNTTPVKQHYNQLNTSTPSKQSVANHYTVASPSIKQTAEYYTVPKPSTPIVIRDISVDVDVSVTTPSYENSPLNMDRVRQAAEEINANVRSLTKQANNESTPVQSNNNSRPETLIVTYDVPNATKLTQGTPPERDVPVFDSNVQHEKSVALNELESNDSLNINTGASMDECQSTMRSLVQSYSDAQKLLTRVVNERPSENQTKLLNVISKTYTAIEENMSEQKKKLDKTLSMSEKHSPIQNSDLFKELEKSLDLISDGPRTSTEMLSLLDKYSNVLVDMITVKIKKRETLID